MLVSNLQGNTKREKVDQEQYGEREKGPAKNGKVGEGAEESGLERGEGKEDILAVLFVCGMEARNMA